MDRQIAMNRFRDLLAECDRKNRLYFLLSLFEGWQIPATAAFGVEVNRFTQYALLDRVKNSIATGIPAQEALLLLQWNLENKAFYAVLRNLVSTLTGRRVMPIPWDQTLGEYRSTGAGKPILISTTVILKNIAADLRTTGFADLGDELESTHITRVKVVRNGSAHAAFLSPNGQNSDWTFGDYEADGKGGIKAVEHRMSATEFQQLIVDFFTLRFAFLAEVAGRKEALRGQDFRFQAENQRNPGEILDCHFDKGAIGFTYQGTPIW